MEVSWKLDMGLTAGVIGTTVNCGPVEFGSGPSPAPYLTNYLWASVSSSVTFYSSQIQCLGRMPGSPFILSSSSF